MTHLFQSRTTARAEEFTIYARLREERMTVYSGFAGTILEFRSAQYSRALRAFEGTDTPAYADARATSQRVRVVAWQALYRIRLIAGSSEVRELAENAMTLAADMHESADKATLSTRGNDVRAAVEAFIAAATAEVAVGNGLVKPRTAPSVERGAASV
ncbi:hypothetical protein ACIBEJ_40330 [Nonomuraea sp. NPDC050790]|uniref:hypothetical protein n=1 Tax=Nonomuraea sp. NPDC050790 TaxID=3364371 RepID=UPI00378D918B